LDSDYELESDDDDLFVDNVVEEYIDQGKGKGKKIGTEDQVLVYDEDHDYDSTDDDLDLPESSHGKGFKFKTFKEEDMVNPIFKVGMLFPSVEILRKAITEYSLRERVEIKMPRNDRMRVRAHCADGCPWYKYASFDSRAKAFMVKNYCGSHNCQRESGFSRDALLGGFQRSMWRLLELMRR